MTTDPQLGPVKVAELILDFFRALAWPTVVLVAIGWFRTPLRQKVLEILKLRFPGGEAVFREAAEQLESEIAEPASVLTHSQTEADTDSRNSDDDQEREHARRRAVERIVRYAFAMGQRLGQREPDIRREPRIRWDDGGEPQVEFTSAERDNQDRYRASVLAAVRRVVGAGPQMRLIGRHGGFVVTTTEGQSIRILPFSREPGSVPVAFARQVANAKEAVIVVSNGPPLRSIRDAIEKRTPLAPMTTFVRWSHPHDDETLAEALRKATTPSLDFSEGAVGARTGDSDQ